MERIESGGWTLTIFSGRLPLGIVLMHEIKGVDEYALSVGKKLSDEGYWVAVPDLFQGTVASSVEEGRKLKDALSRKDVLDAMSRAVSIMRERTGGPRIGSMGFCMGGGFALLGACNLDIVFCVDYYGMIEDTDQVEGLEGPLQLMLGTEDKHVTPWALKDLLPAMVEKRKRVDMHLYPRAEHAFHRPDWPGHEPVAAKDAWSKTMRFLGERMD